MEQCCRPERPQTEKMVPRTGFTENTWGAQVRLLQAWVKLLGPKPVTRAPFCETKLRGIDNEESENYVRPSCISNIDIACFYYEGNESSENFYTASS